MLIVISFNMKNLLFDVVSRSCKYQLEGYWQQSLHQLGKMDIFPHSGLCMFIYYLTSGLIIITVSWTSRYCDNNPLILVIWRILTQRTRSLDRVLLYKGRMHGENAGEEKIRSANKGSRYIEGVAKTSLTVF